MTELFLVYAQTGDGGEYPVVALPTEAEALQYVAKMNELMEKLDYEEDKAFWTPDQKNAANHIGHLDPAFIWGGTDYYGVVHIRTVTLGHTRKEYLHHMENVATLMEKVPKPNPVVMDRNRTRAMQV